MNPLGYHQPRHGRTSIIVLGGRRLDEIEACVSHLTAQTFVPHEFVIVIDPADDETVDTLNGWAEARNDFRVCQASATTTYAKRVNDGLARANGEYVVCVDVSTQVSAGWLGRLQWWADQNREWGVISPTLGLVETLSGADQHRAQRWGQSTLLETIDRRCVMLHRRALDRVGGMDVALGAVGLEWSDYLNRLRIAGFCPQQVGDVPVGVVADTPIPDETSQDRFATRWGQLDGSLTDVSFTREDHFRAFGAEEGFRLDARPVTVEEAAERNLLIMPPWDQPNDLDQLLSILSMLPISTAAWLRCPPGEAPAHHVRLTQSLERIGMLEDETPTLLLVDARLAPEREAGLYRAADAVFVQDDWPGVALVIRRASDSGLAVLRGQNALEAWLRADE